MKKHHLHPFSCIVGLVCIFFCTFCDKVDQGTYDFFENGPLINIGVAHNAVLQSVLDELSTFPSTRTGEEVISKDKVRMIAWTKVEELVYSYELIDTLQFQVLDNLEQFAVTNAYQEELSNIGLNPIQLRLAKDLEKVFDDNDKDLSSLLRRIVNITVKAKLLLSGNELETFLTTCNVAASTLEYWYENTDKWIAVSPAGKKKPEASKSFSWKKLAKEDMKGALSAAGGAVCSYLLGFGPVGWKAWCAYVLGGAVVGSLDNAIEQLWPDDDNEKK